MRISLSLAFILSVTFSFAQKEISLYPGAVPNSKSAPDQETTNKDNVVKKVSKPTLSVFLPPKEKATGAAVVVCPGGGYGVLVIGREGYDVAKAFNDRGIAAFVLKYRLPSDEVMVDKSIAPLQDAQQAIKLIRENAGEWNVDAKKVGIMGFSAGGHLAATAGTHFEKVLIENKKQTSVRPDFMVLVYPVVSFLEVTGHMGSRENLLGKGASDEKIQLYSNELHVNSNTPPAFITHASDDKIVPVANSLLFYEALQKNGVLSEMHIYSKGDHGYLKYPAFDEWFTRVTNWMQVSGF